MIFHFEYWIIAVPFGAQAAGEAASTLGALLGVRLGLLGLLVVVLALGSVFASTSAIMRGRTRT